MKLELSIAGMGICSSLGFHADRVCAALRAGLERPEALPGLEVDDPQEIVGMAVGHRIQGFSDGFIQTGRWIRLADQGLSDLAGSMVGEPEKRALWGTRTAVLPVVPYAFDNRLDWSVEQSLDVASESFMGVLQSVSGLSFQFERSFVHFGHAGVSAALEKAHRLLNSARCDRVIVLAVDSYVELLSLLALIEGDRLKTPSKPTGLVPGEACVCFSLEKTLPSMQSASPQILAANSVYDASALTPIRDDPPRIICENLVRIIQKTLEEGCADSPFGGEVVLDQNGEMWKTNIWAQAYARLSQITIFQPSNLIIPASSVGEIGAASAALGICFGAHACARGFSKQNKILVVSIAENGDVGSVLVGKVS